MKDAIVTKEILLSEISRLFAESGIHQVERSKYEQWPTVAQAFEDEYAILATWTFESTNSLVEQWGAAQDLMVKLLGSNVNNNDPKSWEGYLILVALDGVPGDLVADISNIRTDTRRVRKLVITADDLPRRISDPLQITPHLRRLLAPVLDIQISDELGRSDPLDSLFERFSGHLDTARHINRVVAAYEAGNSPLEALHEQIALAHKNMETHP